MLDPDTLRAAPADDARPAMTEPKPEGRSTGRAGKAQIAAYLDKIDQFTVQELCLRLSRERGARVTLQQFIVEALTHECERHGVKLTGKS
jgi:hypothetical protein